MKGDRKSIHAITTWVRRWLPKVKAFLVIVSGMAALVLLYFIVHNHDNLFIVAKAVHSLGIFVHQVHQVHRFTSSQRPNPVSASFQSHGFSDTNNELLSQLSLLHHADHTFSTL
ncbi:hypothetical protein RJT34_28595 [Clitoria ternatea]|uniref:Uncharacterized protein n=1 Tax=Clitoria ternatea TaxID=43366 RepID=A0AAN9FHV6_CLITE